MMRTGLSAWLSVTGEKLTQVLYSIEDSPLGRQVKGRRRTGLRTWFPVTGAKLLYLKKGRSFVEWRTDPKRRIGLRTCLSVTGTKVLQYCTV
jgi:hypothetical protein